MNIYAKADQWLIGTVFEPTAWWCQYRYDFGHPQLARGSYLMAFVVSNCIAPVLSGDLLSLAFGMVLVLFFDYAFGRNIEKDATQTSGRMNPLRGLWIARLVMVVVILTLEVFIGGMFSGNFWKTVKSISFDLLILVAMFYSACNPMPPWFRQKQEQKDVGKYLAPDTV